MSKNVGIILIILGILSNNGYQAQKNTINDTLKIECYLFPEIPDSLRIFDLPEVQAEFPGGIEKLKEYLNQNVKYTSLGCAEGKVFVQFTINKDGSIENIVVLKGIDKNLNNEALRVVNSMPNWTPASNNGIPVRSNFVLPIKFQLE